MAGSELLEFVIAVPLLLLLVIGAWDFGAAFVLKQKLTNAAREGARIVASVPSNTVDANGNACSPPCNIQAGVNAVVQYLKSANLDASCIYSATPSSATPLNGWVYSCGNGIRLEIDRGIVSPNLVEPYDNVTLPSGTVAVGETVVTLTYPFTWTQGQLLPPPIPSKLTSEVQMQNLTP
jgi:Flp pilus assembly protein TadG